MNPGIISAHIMAANNRQERESYRDDSVIREMNKNIEKSMEVDHKKEYYISNEYSRYRHTYRKKSYNYIMNAFTLLGVSSLLTFLIYSITVMIMNYEFNWYTFILLGFSSLSTIIALTLEEEVITETSRYKKEKEYSDRVYLYTEDNIRYDWKWIKK